MRQRFQFQNVGELQARLNVYAPEFFSLILFFLLVYQIDLTWFNTHMARDLMRADLGNFGWLGPEMGWDLVRLPGPAYYWLLKPLTWLQSVPRILFIKSLFTTACIYFLLCEIKRHFPRLIIYFCFFFVSMPLFILSSRNLWNPAWVIPLNSLIFAFFLRYSRQSTAAPLWICFFLGAFGVQVHFSALLIFLSVAIAAFLLPQHPQHRRHLSVMIGILGTWLLGWYLYSASTSFHDQLHSFYGSSYQIMNRVDDLASLFSIQPFSLSDYDLYYFLLKAFGRLTQQDYSLLEALCEALGYLFLVATFIAAWRAGTELKKKPDIKILFVLIHFAIVVVSIFTFTGKTHLPYRYGLALFPIHFFLLSWWLTRWKESLQPIFFRGLAAFFILHLFFVFKMYEAQDELKRSHHTISDTLELNLREKRKLYQDVLNIHPTVPEPFIYLHGRAANKMRLKEMNWQQTEPYFLLWRFQSGQYPQLNSNLMEWPSQASHIVYLENRSVELLPLSEAHLPQNIHLTYYNSQGENIGFQDWKNANLILPMAFFEQPENVSEIVVQFDLAASDASFLNLLIDDSSMDLLAYNSPFQILTVQELGEVHAPFQKYSGGFLVQSQHIFELPKNRTAVFEIRLKSNLRMRHYSRLDLFASINLFAAEEIKLTSASE